MRTYSFERLDVWHLSRNLVTKIYRISTGFPQEEQFGLRSQMRRASISISSNLAEGSAKISPKARANHTAIAYGSLMELLCQLILCNDLGLISGSTLDQIREEIEGLSNKLNALRNAQLNK